MKITTIVLAASLMLSLTACFQVKGQTDLTSGPEQTVETKSQIEDLRAKYPEYFELSSFKGIEVYVWQMSEDSYHCGMMSGTNRNKTDEEIWDLAKKSLSIEEAKMILNEFGVKKEDVFIIPVIQPISSYRYEIDDAYREKVRKLFE
ncbi:MAG: hypothetical protein K5869_01560 [Saccharofermentans sp.]|nr:hypothetical protein [Saccharofermentans sp.]